MLNRDVRRGDHRDDHHVMVFLRLYRIEESTNTQEYSIYSTDNAR